LIVDDDTMIRYASPSARSIFGDQIVVGASLDTLLVSEDHLLPARSIESYARSTDWTVRRSDAEHVQVEASAQDLTSDPTVRGFVVTLRDVTKPRQLERELKHHAFHDSLTGLANRLLFQDRVGKAVARAARNGTVTGVLFIDLDDFKVVNDTMGHHAGDQLLVAVANRLIEVLRPQDSAARLGGDEFAALIENMEDPAAIEDIAARILSVLSEPFMVGDALVSGASSVGVATTLEAATEPDLLRQADLALYVAKGGGKGQWRRYQSALHTAVLKRMQVRTELDQAVKEDAFELLFQPIVELIDGNPVGYEALLRWNHPQQGMVTPTDFIDVAEESGLIVPIGDWVIQTAINAAVEWDDMSYVSVNVSARQFRSPGFVAKIRTRLAESGLSPTRLMLEITESLLLPDEEQVWADLDELRTLGVQIAIDDFGTGYSSLSYLRRVPADVVKVDRSFVETIGSSGQQRALVEGIVWLAATLGLQVIAEGIETEADRQLLLDLGCPMGQGYLFSPPVRQEVSLAWRSGGSLPAAASGNGNGNKDSAPVPVGAAVHGFRDNRGLPRRAASL
jgi:diguanylate cyclase (GGDEF)-like protein